MSFDGSGSEIRKDIYSDISFEECDEKNVSWDYYCSHREIFHYEFIELEESDGVVPVSSAIDFPNSYKDQLLYSNHQQMRNDRNTKRSTTDLMFVGKYCQFFKTEQK